MVYRLHLEEGGYSTAAGDLGSCACEISTLIGWENVVAISVEDPKTPDDEIGEYFEIWRRGRGFSRRVCRLLGVELEISILQDCDPSSVYYYDPEEPIEPEEPPDFRTYNERRPAPWAGYDMNCETWGQDNFHPIPYASFGAHLTYDPNRLERELGRLENWGVAGVHDPNFRDFLRRRVEAFKSWLAQLRDEPGSIPPSAGVEYASWVRELRDSFSRQAARSRGKHR